MSKVLAYTAKLGQYGEADIDSIPERAPVCGAELGRLIDCMTLAQVNNPP